jgi:signal transduction histidine kinase
MRRVNRYRLSAVRPRHVRCVWWGLRQISKTHLGCATSTVAEPHCSGVIAVGVSRHRELNQEYKGFFELIARRVAAAIAEARAYEAERRRAEALAEIDRAKTAFFSNISHEFRTPLTLMLGPLEEMKAELGRSGASLSPAQYQQTDLAHRNGLRLLELVNTLLNFSRIEAGRVQARAD